MTEVLMRKRFKKLLKCTNIHFDHIETGTTQIGYPDEHFYSVFGASSPFVGWMELKHVHSFSPSHIVIPWRPGQLIRGDLFVKARINLWLCVLADKTNTIRFIPGYNWQPQYNLAQLKRVTSCTHNIQTITPIELIRVLRVNQYQDERFTQ